jgi:AcrR family transcriptional regulator
MRALADAVGASPQIVYSHIGNKGQVIEALYEDGFARLADMFEEASKRGTARSRLRKCAEAYRDFARENVALFELMYGSWIRDLLPSPDDRRAARPSLSVLKSVFHLGQERREFRKKEPLDQARQFWSAIHGVVVLELTNWFDSPEADQRFKELVEILIKAQSIDHYDR